MPGGGGAQHLGSAHGARGTEAAKQGRELQWWSSERKTPRTSHRSDLDLLSSGDRLHAEHWSKCQSSPGSKHCPCAMVRACARDPSARLFRDGGGKVAMADARSLSFGDGSQRGAELRSERPRTVPRHKKRCYVLTPHAP